MRRKHVTIGDLWAMPNPMFVFADRQGRGFCMELRTGSPGPRSAGARSWRHRGPDAACRSEHRGDAQPGRSLAGGDWQALVIYYVGNDAALRFVLDELRRELGRLPLVIPVPVPHFYYDGLLIEVDVFAHAGPYGTFDRANGALRQNREGRRLHLGLDRMPSLVDGAEVAQALQAAGLSSKRLLCDHWYASGASAVPSDSRLVSDPGAAVRIQQGDAGLIGELTFCREEVVLDQRNRKG